MLKGSFTSPSFGLDPKGVQEQASKVLSNELGRQINKLFKQSDQTTPQGTDQQPAEKQPSPAENPAKSLQDSLQKLFGN